MFVTILKIHECYAVILFQSHSFEMSQSCWGHTERLYFILLHVRQV